jgi:pimeloyl-ACP methyl ester carboxylesterase
MDFPTRKGWSMSRACAFFLGARNTTRYRFCMHPASTLQLLPVPRAAARRGAHVLCAGSRYARNDTAAIFEKVAQDLRAYIRHAKEVWGYERVVLIGWSGGGSLALFYQSQAEAQSVTQTPAGDPVDLTKARLIPADAVIVQAAQPGQEYACRAEGAGDRGGRTRFRNSSDHGRPTIFRRPYRAQRSQNPLV